MATEVVHEYHEYWGYFNLNFRSILIGLAIFLLIFRWLRQPRHENLPPGPSGWPVFGYVLNLGVKLYRTGAQPFELFTQLSRTYGKVYCMYLGSQRVVILNGHECIREAFQNPLLNDRPVLQDQTEANTGKHVRLNPRFIRLSIPPHLALLFHSFIPSFHQIHPPGFVLPIFFFLP